MLLGKEIVVCRRVPSAPTLHLDNVGLLQLQTGQGMDHVLLYDLLHAFHCDHISSRSEDGTGNRVVQNIMCHGAFVTILLGNQGFLVVRIVDEGELDVHQFLHLKGLPGDRVGNGAVWLFQFL